MPANYGQKLCHNPGRSLDGKLHFVGQFSQSNFAPVVELLAQSLQGNKCLHGIVRHLWLATTTMGARFALGSLGSLNGPFQLAGTPAVANGLLGKGVTTFTILDTQEYQPMAAGEGGDVANDQFTQGFYLLGSVFVSQTTHFLGGVDVGVEPCGLGLEGFCLPTVPDWAASVRWSLARRFLLCTPALYNLRRAAALSWAFSLATVFSIMVLVSWQATVNFGSVS